MNTSRSAAVLSGAFLALGTLVGCAGDSSKKARSAEGIVRPLADDVVVLEFQGGKVTAKDLNEGIDSKIKQAQEDIVQSYTQEAQQIALQKIVEAEAKAQGKSVDQMLADAIGSVDVTDAQVDELFKQRPELKKGFVNPQTGKRETVTREMVKMQLGRQEQMQRQRTFLEGVMAKAQMKTKLELPRVAIAVSDDMASAGSKTAKVVIHEFSDFECPFCARGKQVVSQIKSAYGDKVRVVFRHFPLDRHENAKPAALATICANKDGKFWELHDKMFDNQTSITTANILKWSQELGLDTKKIETCMGAPETAKLLERDLSDASKLGVNSTPTFFVNGKRVAGALPFEQFKTMIDAELAKN